MAIGYLDSQKLTDIANAIRSASSSEISYTVDEMPEAIRDIAPEQPRVFKDVNFFDYDGTILYQYDLAEAKALTALPPLPSSPRSGYTADSWTETLSFIQNLTGPCDVGVNYTTTNDFSEIKLSIPEDNYQVCTKGCAYDSQESSGIFTWIEWGDGTEREKLSSTRRIIHTYAQKGDYYVKIYASYQTYYFPDPYVSSSAGTYEEGAMIMPYPYIIGNTKSYLIQEIWVGRSLNVNCRIHLAQCQSIKSIMIPQYFSSANQIGIYSKNAPFKHLTMSSSSTLLTLGSTMSDVLGGPESIVLPSVKATNVKPLKNCRRFINYNNTFTDAFKGCEKLETLVLQPVTIRTATFEKDGFTAINFPISGTVASTFLNCQNLKSADLSDLEITSLPNGFFEGTASLKSVVFPTTLTSIGATAFRYSGIEHINLHEGITTLSNYTFAYSEISGSLTIPSTCQTIPGDCFNTCSALTEVHILANQPILSGWAFSYCINLTAVYIYSAQPGAAYGTTFYEANNAIIYVPREGLQDWINACPQITSTKFQAWDPPTD